MPKAGFSHKCPTPERLIELFEEQWIPEPNSGCWLWIGSIVLRGEYGCFTCRPAGIQTERAHRLSWKLYRGILLPTDHVLHSCDTPLCVNPDHLFLGDQQVNVADMVYKGRQAVGERHGRRKLTEAQAIKIRNDLRLLKDIASDYGVTTGTVSAIRRGISWSYLESRVLGVHKIVVPLAP